MAKDEYRKDVVDKWEKGKMEVEEEGDEEEGEEEWDEEEECSEWMGDEGIFNCYYYFFKYVPDTIRSIDLFMFSYVYFNCKIIIN